MSENVEENILLAGQISNAIPIFKTIAQMDHDSAFLYHFLDLLPELRKKDKTATEKLKDILLLNGRVNFMTGSSELSKLSAIVGDSRKRYSAKNLKEVLEKIDRNTTTTQ